MMMMGIKMPIVPFSGGSLEETWIYDDDYYFNNNDGDDDYDDYNNNYDDDNHDDDDDGDDGTVIAGAVQWSQPGGNLGSYGEAGSPWSGQGYWTFQFQL